MSRQAQQAMLNHVLDLMSNWAPVSARAMFGGHGIYREGLMFGLMYDERLYLKADEQSMGAFTDLGLGPFTFESKGKVGHLRYFEAPSEVYDEPVAMAQWARLGFECAVRQRKPAAVSKRRKGTGSVG